MNNLNHFTFDDKSKAVNFAFHLRSTMIVLETPDKTFIVCTPRDAVALKRDGCKVVKLG